MKNTKVKQRYALKVWKTAFICYLLVFSAVSLQGATVSSFSEYKEIKASIEIGVWEEQNLTEN